jgi:hypothetical protein
MAQVHTVKRTKSDAGSAGNNTAQIVKMHHDKITPICPQIVGFIKGNGSAANRAAANLIMRSG